ncbi:MAG: yaaI [Nitrospira sp.]|jgi:nicotinamidase-related amidase|nr:yaaI [Nitrospira sp.]
MAHLQDGITPKDSNHTGTCLLIIDMINTFSFPDSEKLFPAVVESAGRIARFKQRATKAGIPAIYVNDNFGKWRHDFGRLVEHCLYEPCRGRPVAELLHPAEHDYFVLKPKHSGFYATPLELLLKFLGARRLILTGVAGDNCVLYTAADAYMREFSLCVPADCIVSIDAGANDMALAHMQTNLKADLQYSDDLDLQEVH